MTLLKRLSLLSGVTRFKFLSVSVTSPITDFLISVSIPANKRFLISFGDGDSEIVVGPLVHGAYVFHHTYVSPGSYQLELTGSYRDITEITVSSPALTGNLSLLAAMPLLKYTDIISSVGMDYTHTVLPPWNGSNINLNFNNARLSTSEVDQFLIDFDLVSGVAGGLCRVHIESPCSSPSATGLAAKDRLVAKGWTIYVA